MKRNASTALDAALGYIRRGWCPIPVPYREKGPTIDQWQTLRLSEADARHYFNGARQNVGVLLGPSSHNLTDVDLDSDEAIAAAALLPPTIAFGRSSTPGAHRIYTCQGNPPDKTTILFKDPTRKGDAASELFLELRLGQKSAAQTVFPPSTHKGGEAIRWQSGDGTRVPLVIGFDELAVHCRRVAAGALLIRHWPAKGSQHELSLAIGGALARAGWTLEDIERLVTVTANAAHDPRPADRVRCARDAAENVAAGEPTFGFPKLKEILGEAVAGRLAEWLELAPASGRTCNGPVIRLSTDLTAAAESAERSILGAGLPVYRRSALLVRPLILDAYTFDGNRAKTVGLLAVPTIMLRGYMGQAATFEKFNGRTKDWVACKPPTDVAEFILGRSGHWPFHEIRGVLAAPSMRPDGSILGQPGFDPATGMYLIDPPAMPDIAEKPTHQDAVQALQLLDSLLDSFPWQGDDDSRAVGLSMLISPLMRACLPAVPMHCVSAPAPGTGKSFLCDLAAALATGFPCVVMAAGKDEEELEKRLSSAVLDGMPVVAIDNVSRPLGGDFLCQVLDRPLVKVRLLGKSEGPKLEPRLILFATGNNLTLVGDIGRRAVIAHMDAACENPHQRQFADNPLASIIRDRGTYIAAALTLCRAFRLSGDQPEARLASFEQWSDTVRSAIRWAGGGDAVRTMATIAADDPARERQGAVLAAWDKTFGSDAVSVSDIIKRALERDQTGGLASPELHDALMAVAATRGGTLDNRRLGYWLRQHRDKVLNRRALRRSSTVHNDNLARWYLQTS
jgi:hypothetical protein